MNQFRITQMYCMTEELRSEMDEILFGIDVMLQIFHDRQKKLFATFSQSPFTLGQLAGKALAKPCLIW